MHFERHHKIDLFGVIPKSDSKVCVVQHFFTVLQTKIPGLPDIFFQVFYSPSRPSILFLYFYIIESAICRPSDRTVGRPRTETRTPQEARKLANRSPHLLLIFCYWHWGKAFPYTLIRYTLLHNTQWLGLFFTMRDAGFKPRNCQALIPMSHHISQ